ncbi:hypothetical protein [uncultured Pseudacidovorax sp.]|uniref:hypothetical protein n=1 Tax=uncultured Pseudacidovorax sp. TaxID=679313 RepID=UPI0025D67AB7|nr:hypothetical protein [uncultured Pseudacidovorax sp.]
MQQHDPGILEALDQATIDMGRQRVTPMTDDWIRWHTVPVPLPSGGKVWITYESVRGSRKGCPVWVWVAVSARFAGHRRWSSIDQDALR